MPELKIRYHALDEFNKPLKTPLEFLRAPWLLLHPLGGRESSNYSMEPSSNRTEQSWPCLLSALPQARLNLPQHLRLQLRTCRLIPHEASTSLSIQLCTEHLQHQTQLPIPCLLKSFILVLGGRNNTALHQDLQAILNTMQDILANQLDLRKRLPVASNHLKRHLYF